MKMRHKCHRCNVLLVFFSVWFVNKQTLKTILSQWKLFLTANNDLRHQTPFRIFSIGIRLLRALLCRLYKRFTTLQYFATTVFSNATALKYYNWIRWITIQNNYGLLRIVFALYTLSDVNCLHHVPPIVAHRSKISAKTIWRSWLVSIIVYRTLMIFTDETLVVQRDNDGADYELRIFSLSLLLLLLVIFFFFVFFHPNDSAVKHVHVFKTVHSNTTPRSYTPLPRVLYTNSSNGVIKVYNGLFHARSVQYCV